MFLHASLPCIPTETEYNVLKEKNLFEEKLEKIHSKEDKND